MGLWQDYLHTQFDPAHLFSELGFSVVFELAQLLLWTRFLKRRCHAAFDLAHGVTHTQGEGEGE